MLVLFIVLLSTALLFLLFGWAIKYKKAYWIISNFNGRSKEEQDYLIKNGMPEKMANLMILTGLIMIMLLPLNFVSFRYAVEVQMGAMLIFLLGGFIYLSKYEIPSKRKKSYIISTSTTIGTIVLILVIMGMGNQDNDIILKADTFEITGAYGEEYKYSDIKQIEVINTLPEIKYKVNGFRTQTIAKGVFNLKDYGKSLLFIKHGSSPYIYIHVSDTHIFINSKDSEETQEWYESLQGKSKLQ